MLFVIDWTVYVFYEVSKRVSFSDGCISASVIPCIYIYKAVHVTDCDLLTPGLGLKRYTHTVHDMHTRPLSAEHTAEGLV